MLAGRLVALGGQLACWLADWRLGIHSGLVRPIHLGPGSFGFILVDSFGPCWAQAQGPFGPLSQTGSK